MFNKNKILPFLLWTLAFTFITFLLILSYNVRPCSDDLVFINRLSEKGWFHSISEFPYNIRWSSYLLLNSIFYPNQNFQTIHWNIFIYYILLFSFLFFSLSKLIKAISTHFLIHISTQESLLLSILFSIPLYFITTESIEIWFWVSGSTVYFVPIIFFIWGLSLILSSNTSIFNFIGVFIAFTFIGGALESFALTSIFCLLAFILALKINQKLTKVFAYKTGLAILSITILLIAGILHEGIENRLILESTKKQYNSVNSLDLLYQSIKEFKNLVFIYYSIVIFSIGSYFKESKRLLPSFNFSKKSSLYLFIFITVICFITITPLLVTFHNIGPRRAWFPINFTLWMIVLGICFYLGNKLNSQILQKPILHRFLIFGGLLIIIFYTYKQTITTQKFAKQYDKRVAKLLKLEKKGNKKDIYLKPLPDSGMIASAELTTLKSNTNSNLIEALNLNYRIYLSNKKLSK